MKAHMDLVHPKHQWHPNVPTITPTSDPTSTSIATENGSGKGDVNKTKKKRSTKMISSARTNTSIRVVNVRGTNAKKGKAAKIRPSPNKALQEQKPYYGLVCILCGARLAPGTLIGHKIREHGERVKDPNSKLPHSRSQWVKIYQGGRADGNTSHS
jgi:hypothetical protein